MKLKYILLASICLLSLLGFWMAERQSSKDFQDLKSVQKDFPFPTGTKIRNISTEQDFQLTGLKGKVSLINFWASWCPPCVVELPQLLALHERFGDQLQILLIQVDDDKTREELLAEWKKRNTDLHLFQDPKGVLQTQLNVETIPSTFLVDQSGQVRLRHHIAADWSSRSAKRFIENLMQSK